MRTLLVLITLLFSSCGSEVIIKFKGEGPNSDTAQLFAISYKCPDGYAMTGRLSNDNSYQIKRITCTKVLD